MSAVAASSFAASDVGRLAFQVEARPGLVVGRDGQGSSVSALVIRFAYPCMSQVTYFGSRCEMPRSNLIELWWPLGLVPIILLSTTGTGSTSRLRRTSSPTTSWAVQGPDRAVVM